MLSDSRRLLSFLIGDAYQKLGWRFLAVVALGFFVAVIDTIRLVAVFLLFPFLGITSISTSSALSRVREAFVAVGVPYDLWVVGALVASIGVVYAFLSAGLSWYQASYSQYYALLWRRYLSKSLLRASWSFFLSASSGRLTSVLSTETAKVQSALIKFFFFSSNLFVALTYLVGALIVSSRLTFLMLVVGVTVVALNLFVVKKMLSQARAVVQGNQKLLSACSDVLSNIKVIKSASYSGRSEQVLERAFVGVFRSERVRYWLPDLSKTFSETLVMFALILTIVGLSLMSGGNDAQASLMLLALFTRTYGKVTQVLSYMQQMFVELPSLEFARSVASESARQREDGTSSRLIANAPPMEAGIDLKGVTVAHGEKTILYSVDLKLGFGTVTALVGPSGAGKTTLVDTLLRLNPVMSGKIEVGGITSEEYWLASWRSCIGYVPQDITLFDVSIAENIRFFQPESDMSAVREAARRANADEFIAELPEGYETNAGEGGLRLSGGQRQRIALARALLGQPKLLILDEMTSALDSNSEEKILAAIMALRKQMIVVIIAHRLATVRSADRIYVLDRGRIVESGSWTELLARGGVFAELASKGDLFKGQGGV